MNTAPVKTAPNVQSVTRVVPRTANVPSPRRAPRRGTASVEYRALHAIVRSLALVGGAVARLMPFGTPASARRPLLVESREIADSVVPFVFQVA